MNAEYERLKAEYHAAKAVVEQARAEQDALNAKYDGAGERERAAEQALLDYVYRDIGLVDKLRRLGVDS